MFIQKHDNILVVQRAMYIYIVRTSGDSKAKYTII